MTSSGISWLDDRDLPEWDEFTRRTPGGTVFHTSSWREVLHIAFPHLSGRFLVVRSPESGRIQGGIPVYAGPNRLTGTLLCSTPWATHCDPLADDPATCRTLIEGLIASCRQVGARSLQVRTLVAASQVEDCGLSPQAVYKHHRLELDKPFEEIQRSFSRSAIRAMVSKARKRGYCMVMAGEPKDIAVFHDLLAHTRQRLGLPLIPQRFFDAIREKLIPLSANLLFAARGDEIAAGLLVLKHGTVLTLEYAGERPGARKDGVNQLIYAEAVALAAREGFSQVSFGRTATDNSGLLAYKRHFGTVEEDLINFVWPTGPKARRNVRDSGLAMRAVGILCRYLPLRGRRALGELLYRHVV